MAVSIAMESGPPETANKMDSVLATPHSASPSLSAASNGWTRANDRLANGLRFGRDHHRDANLDARYFVPVNGGYSKSQLVESEPIPVIGDPLNIFQYEPCDSVVIAVWKIQGQSVICLINRHGAIEFESVFADAYDLLRRLEPFFPGPSNDQFQDSREGNDASNATELVNRESYLVTFGLE